MREKHSHNVMKDLAIIIFSFIAAIVFVKTGTLKNILDSAQEMKLLGSFISGIFFVSVFTAIPATVIIAELAKTNSIFLVVLFGGFGALFGDLIIFRFIKDSLSEDFFYLIKKSGSERFFSIFKIRLFRWIVPFIGALVVASPLPDELGLAMMGLSKMKTSLFIPIAFILNSLGILAICLLARSF